MRSENESLQIPPRPLPHFNLDPANHLPFPRVNEHHNLNFKWSLISSSSSGPFPN